jgi:hypothetical protein
VSNSPIHALSRSKSHFHEHHKHPGKKNSKKDLETQNWAPTPTHQRTRQVRMLAMQLESTQAGDREHARQMAREKEVLQERELRAEAAMQRAAEERVALADREAQVAQMQAVLSQQLGALHKVTSRVWTPSSTRVHGCYFLRGHQGFSCSTTDMLQRCISTGSLPRHPLRVSHQIRFRFFEKANSCSAICVQRSWHTALSLSAICLRIQSFRRVVYKFH